MMFKERIKTHHSAMSEGKKYVRGVAGVKEALSEGRLDDPGNATIYVHVPYCSKICSFCNMRRTLQTPDRELAPLIVRDIAQYASLPYIRDTRFDAVYFGGGTPTTLSAEELVSILSAMREHLHFTEDAEFTIETTVTELTQDKSDALVAAGVNRFSVGVQTFDDRGRKSMNRTGTGDAAYKRLAALRQYKDVTVSMDLIYNYPGQTDEDLERDLDRIAALSLDGFSLYSLINMKEASIGEAQNEERDERFFMRIAQKMRGEGYEFLELTKMVKGDRYKYITNRHRAADTLPLGAGAGGSVDSVALMTPVAVSEYASYVEDFDQRQGMRFAKEYDEVTRFKGDLQTCRLPRNEALYRDREAYEKMRASLLEEGLIEPEEGGYRLTDAGIFWGNTISRKLSELL